MQPMAAQATKPAQPARTRARRPAQQQLTETRRIAALAAKGNTERDISALTGIPKTTIHQTLQQLKMSPDYQTYCDNKADVLEMIQFQIANAVDHASIKTMLSKRGLTDLAILEDKIRLIRGQATDLSAVNIRLILDAAPKEIDSSNIIEVIEET